MAHEWYIQHGGKTYGPLAAAKMKQLAAERKITPETPVRRDSDQDWVPASRVQGLFAPQPPIEPAALPPPIPPHAAPLDPPPLEPPPAPPVASPLARVPLGSVAAVDEPRGAPPAMAPRIIGAFGLVLGILALSTCWLPWLGGPLGWIGIVVGGLGLVLGGCGLVFAALRDGSGLYLNIAGTSSAAVGLVLSIALGVTFGMFAVAAPPQPNVTLKPSLPEPPPADSPPPVEPEPKPQPQPKPQVVWTNAADAIEQGSIKATIAGVGVQSVKLESLDFSTLKPSKPRPMLKIRVTVENTSPNKSVEVPGWPGGGGGPLGNVDVGAILKQTGLLKDSGLEGKIGSVTAAGTLRDNAGDNYEQVPAIRLFGAQTTLGEDSAVPPGNSAHKELVFPPPLDTIEYLRLELAPGGFSGTEPLRFEIPRAMIRGL